MTILTIGRVRSVVFLKGSDKDRDDLYAATPPLEAKKYLISCAASQLGVPQSKQKRLSFIDIKKAYFNAPAKRDLFVDLPGEFLEPGGKGNVCGNKKFSSFFHNLLKHLLT